MEQSEKITEIPTLETGKYLLRRVEHSDAAELYEFMSDKETMKYITPNPVKSVTEMMETVSEYLNSFEKKKQIPWVIEDKLTSQVIGLFRFHKLNYWHRKAEMGVVIRKEFQNKGVMTEVFRTMVPYGFEELELNRIVGDIFSGNKGSERLLQKFGFVKEGTLRETDFDGKDYHDTVVFSMLREEFHEKKELFEEGS